MDLFTLILSQTVLLSHMSIRGLIAIMGLPLEKLCREVKSWNTIKGLHLVMSMLLGYL